MKRAVFFNFAILMQPHLWFITVSTLSSISLVPFFHRPFLFEQGFYFELFVPSFARRVSYARSIHLHRIPAAISLRIERGRARINSHRVAEFRVLCPCWKHDG